MSVANCEDCNETAERIEEYVPCAYERLIHIVSKKAIILASKERWKDRVLISIALYCLIVGLFYAAIAVFNRYINDTQPYRYAVFVIASLIFWPTIIIFDSELFYKTCKKLSCLFTPEAKTLSWYREDAMRYFRFFPDNEYPAWFAIVVNVFCSLFVLSVYLVKVYAPDLIPALTDTPAPIFLSLVACALTVVLQNRSRNILVSMLTVCCGLAYYAYITEYATTRLAPLFVTDFVPGTIIVLFLVGVVFFIAGTTLMPMLGLFKTFFTSSFETKISYPINEIACSLDTIQEVKKYFFHLTGVNLLAYFQLIGSVYFLGLLNTESVVTSVLFVLGSCFPIAMYLAASLFFKKLCHRIYILQVRDVDVRIFRGLQEEKLDAEEIQALVAIKEMYANEFEIHAVMSKEILVAMLSPIATTLAAVLFPASNILGG